MKISIIAGKLAGFFLFLFFLLLGMGIMESPRRSGISPDMLFLMVLLGLSVVCLIVFLIGKFRKKEVICR